MVLTLMERLNGKRVVVEPDADFETGELGSEFLVDEQKNENRPEPVKTEHHYHPHEKKFTLFDVGVLKKLGVELEAKDIGTDPLKT